MNLNFFQPVLQHSHFCKLLRHQRKIFKGERKLKVKTDIEIARTAKKQPIQQIGDKLQIPSDHLLPNRPNNKTKAEVAIEKFQKDNSLEFLYEKT